MREKRAPSTRRSSPPHAAPSVPSPTPSSATPMTGPACPCSAQTAAMWAWWCWMAKAGMPRSAAKRAAKRLE